MEAHRAEALLRPQLLQTAHVPDLNRAIAMRDCQVCAFRVPCQSTRARANVVCLRHCGLIFNVYMYNCKIWLIACCSKARAVWTESQSTDCKLEGGGHMDELQRLVCLVKLYSTTLVRQTAAAKGCLLSSKA